MSEKQEQYFDIVIKLLTIALCAFLYSLGGLDGITKGVRRYLAPLICAGSCYHLSRDKRTLLYAFLGIPLFGYGADVLWEKIVRRGLYGLKMGIFSSVYNITYKRWIIVGFQTALLIAAYIAFGVWNPFNSARVEETVLGLLVYAIPVLSVRKRL